MTSNFEEKRAQVMIYDTCVNVDNYVEIGDFFVFYPFFVKTV